MLNSYLSGDLKTGDFIIIAVENYLDVGFYLGRGPTGTMQYYSVITLSDWFSSTKERKPRKSYVNSPHNYRVAKYHPECIENPAFTKMYIDSIEALRILKIIN